MGISYMVERKNKEGAENADGSTDDRVGRIVDEQKDSGKRNADRKDDCGNAKLPASHAQYGSGCKRSGGMTRRAGITSRGMDEKALAGISDERPGTANDRFQNLADKMREDDRKEKHQRIARLMQFGTQI